VQLPNPEHTVRELFEGMPKQIGNWQIEPTYPDSQ